VIDRPCPDDLLAEARRRPLSDLERQAVTSHVAHCADCRTSRQIAQVLHAGDEALAGDAAIVARIAERASARRETPAWRARPSWRRLAVAAAALLCLGTGAFAWVGRRPVPAGVAVPAPAPAKRSRAASAPSRAHDAPDRVLEMSAASVPPPVKSRPSHRAQLPPAVAPSAPSAAALFGEANVLRRAGDLRAAVARYQSLRRQFPESGEARLSAISLGDLLLDLDEPSAALRAFDSYLEDVHTGPLAEEALFGRGRSLRELGRDRAERETWTTLLRDFPRSGYEPAARRRLEELPP